VGTIGNGGVGVVGVVLLLLLLLFDMDMDDIGDIATAAIRGPGGRGCTVEDVGDVAFEGVMVIDKDSICSVVIFPSSKYSMHR
jgi:hypothetical protein